MTFREKTVLAIMLTIARWLAPVEWAKDISQIATNISVHAKEQP